MERARRHKSRAAFARKDINHCFSVGCDAVAGMWTEFVARTGQEKRFVKCKKIAARERPRRAGMAVWT